MADTFEHSAVQMDAVAEELTLAGRHIETAATHFRDELPARAGAHAFAAIGHLRQALRLLSDAAVTFAQRAEPMEPVASPETDSRHRRTG